MPARTGARSSPVECHRITLGSCNEPVFLKPLTSLAPIVSVADGLRFHPLPFFETRLIRCFLINNSHLLRQLLGCCRFLAAALF